MPPKSPDLKTIYDTYLKWLAMPEEDRAIKSIKEWCENYGVTQVQILDFQDLPNFSDDLHAEVLKWAKKKTPELIHLLYKTYLKTKSATDFRAWIEAVQFNRSSSPQDPSSPAGTNIFNIFNVTDEQRRKILERAGRRAGLITDGGAE